jgi:hypothetical protein
MNGKGKITFEGTIDEEVFWEKLPKGNTPREKNEEWRMKQIKRKSGPANLK